MKKLLLAIVSLCSTGAYAYGDHYGWSSDRGGYSGSYQFITQGEVLHSDTTIKPEGDGKETTSSYKGLALKTGIGTELVRFVRFDAYHLLKDMSNNPSDSLRGNEVGGEMKVSFFGPVVNLELGLGLDATRLVNQTSTSSTVYYGQGYSGIVGFERFLGPKASVLFTVKGQQETLHPEDKSVSQKMDVKTIGAALGLLLWLN